MRNLYLIMLFFWLVILWICVLEVPAMRKGFYDMEKAHYNRMHQEYDNINENIDRKINGLLMCYE